MNDTIKLVICLILPQIVGGLGAIATSKSVSTWYNTLAKPVFQPPSSVFGPVWTILYVLMGVAAFYVWKQGWTSEIQLALIFFAIQLVFNTGWSVLFFGMQKILWALIEMAVLWILILVTTVLFFRISKTAGYLMLPYILWVTFAFALNFSIWRLNA